MSESKRLKPSEHKGEKANAAASNRLKAKSITSTYRSASKTKGNKAYEYVGWTADKVLARDDEGTCTIVLREVGSEKMITRKGTIAMLSEPVIFINNLQCYKDIQVCLHKKGEVGIIKKTPSTNARLVAI